MLHSTWTYSVLYQHSVINWWLSARLKYMYLQCPSNGNTIVLHWAIEIMLRYLLLFVFSILFSAKYFSSPSMLQAISNYHFTVIRFLTMFSLSGGIIYINVQVIYVITLVIIHLQNSFPFAKMLRFVCCWIRDIPVCLIGATVCLICWCLHMLSMN